MKNATQRLRTITRRKLAELEVAEQRPVVETNLFELVQALDEETAPDEQGMVARALAHLMRTGRLRWLNGHPPRWNDHQV